MEKKTCGTKNLKPQSMRTKDEQRRIATMGGIASGAARRRRRDMAALASSMLDARLQGASEAKIKAMFPALDDEDVSYAAAIVSGQVNAAIKGNPRSFELLKALDDEAKARESKEGKHREHDFVRITSPKFWDVHYHVLREDEHEFWLPGGRASGKSTHVALEIVSGMMEHPDRSAYVFMKVGADMEGSAYEQIRDAVATLDCAEDWEFRKAPLRAIRKETGQIIRFKGCDDPRKTKSMKAPAGQYYAYVWFEEVDMFDGLAELRTVMQSVTRGGGADAQFFRFYTFNPPRMAESWVNRVCQRREDAGKRVWRSTIYDLPPEWVAGRMLDDAEDLRQTDEMAWRHEYKGESVGIGGLVFDRVEFREITDEEISSFDRQLAGQDFGWYPDPWALTISEWQAGARTLLTFREDGGNKLTPDRQAERIHKALTWREGDAKRGIYHHLPVESDSADPTVIAQQRDSGISARPADKGGRRMASYRWLASIKWIIDPKRCPNLAREVRTKQYRMLRDGRFVEEIPDGNDHWIDATRYAVMPIVKRRSAYRGKDLD